MSREYTPEEVRNALLDHVWSMIDYWRHQANATTEQERMEGLAFSILTMLDGESSELPKFIVAPDPHPDDRPFLIAQGEDYFPENSHLKVASDLGGSLHDNFHSRRFVRADQESPAVPKCMNRTGETMAAKCPHCGNKDPESIEDNGLSERSDDYTLLCVARVEPGTDAHAGSAPEAEPGPDGQVSCGMQWCPNEEGR